jgi:hypothetical protein
VGDGGLFEDYSRGGCVLFEIPAPHITVTPYPCIDFIHLLPP